jgi:hypothetical protein
MALLTVPTGRGIKREWYVCMYGCMSVFSRQVFLAPVAEGAAPATRLTHKLRLAFKDFSKKLVPLNFYTLDTRVIYHVSATSVINLHDYFKV